MSRRDTARSEDGVLCGRFHDCPPHHDLHRRSCSVALLSSLDSVQGGQTSSPDVLRSVLREAAVFLGLYALVFMSSVSVFSSTLGNRVERHLRDIAERQRAQEVREKLILELQLALSKVKLLSGLLPICANCKKIRDDQGYWNQIEHCLRVHSEAEFSHGLCPECIKNPLPGIRGRYVTGVSEAALKSMRTLSALRT